MKTYNGYKKLTSLPHCLLTVSIWTKNLVKVNIIKNRSVLTIAFRNTNCSVFSANRHVLLSYTSPQYGCTVCSNTQEEARVQCYMWYRSCVRQILSYYSWLSAWWGDVPSTTLLFTSSAHLWTNSQLAMQCCKYSLFGFLLPDYMAKYKQHIQPIIRSE